jgi:hypothetical protein
MVFFSSFFVTSMNVYAIDEKDYNRTVIIKSEVDPRVSAQHLNVTLMFSNLGDGSIETVTLNSFSDYNLVTRFPAGDYSLFSGMVSDDLTGYYIITCEDFETYAATTEITVTIGNPKYDGEIEEVDDFMLGGIDREATNELREQHGKPPIDWDEIDRLIEEGYYDIGIVEDVTLPTVSSTQSTPTEMTSSNPTDVTKPNSSTTNTNPNNPTDTNTTPTEIIEQEENKKKTTFSIFFVLSVIGIVSVCIYFRNKNFMVNND